jgi:hypothetical protein
MGDERHWSAVREQFDLARDYIHLSSFFLASHPRPVREAIEGHRRVTDRPSADSLLERPVQTRPRADAPRQTSHAA